MATSWRSSWAGALAVLGVELLGCRKTPVDVPVSWETNVEASVAKARRENKPMVVYFGASWDTSAKELEHRTFTDPDVELLMRRNYVSVRIDTTDDDEPAVRKAADRFKVMLGNAAIVVLAPDGTTEIARVEEFVPPDVFATILQRSMLPVSMQDAHGARVVMRP